MRHVGGMAHVVTWRQAHTRSIVKPYHGVSGLDDGGVLCYAPWDRARFISWTERLRAEGKLWIVGRMQR